MNRFFAATALSFAFAAPLAASSGDDAAAFLQIPVGAGPAALGSAYSMLANDAYAPVYNPAGLAFLDSHQAAGQHLSYLESMSYEFASAAFRLGQTAGLGVSAQYLGSGNIAGLEDDGSKTADYSSHYAAYSLAYGHRLGERLSLGATGKWIEAKIADVSAHAFAADAGLLYRAGGETALSATVTNMGQRLTFLHQGDPLPLSAQVGIKTSPLRRVVLAAEGAYARSHQLAGRFGAEWNPLDMISIRAGYRTDATKELGAMAGLSTGIGLRFWGQEFSYAWVPYGDLGSTQYFSLLLRFGHSEKDRQSFHARDVKPHHGNGSDKDDIENQQMIELLKDDETKSAREAQAPPAAGTSR